jgi:hypothetical protein
MKRLSIVSLVLVGGLTACARADRMDGESGVGNSGGLLLLLFIGVVLYLAVSGLIASLWHRASGTDASFDLASRRVWARSKRTRRRRRRQKPDRGTSHSASVIDSVTRPPAP